MSAPTVDIVEPDDLREVWPILPLEERIDYFARLRRGEADDFFLELGAADQRDILTSVPVGERRIWARLLPPDDVADVCQLLDREGRAALLDQLDEATRREVNALLAYAEDEAGGLMNPRFCRLRPEATVDEAIRYLRRQAQDRDRVVIYYAYVLDAHQRLVGVVSFRQLLAAAGERRIDEIMVRDLLTVSEDLDQESVARTFAQHDLVALPVVNAEGVMRGIVTGDDVVDVVQEEATEDIHQLGGMTALEEPYLRTPFLELVRKRGVWLAVLFVGEMLTATAMVNFEDDIAKAVVLAIFIPLIISSGGNSGSQATTLVIRAMALGEVRLRDWWRVVRRELAMGLALGGILAGLGGLRIYVGQSLFGTYGEHAGRLAIAIGLSLIGVVMLGTTAGSMLPFILRRVGLDPASASAPLVATLVDVTGLIVYFNVASLVLSGTLL